MRKTTNLLLALIALAWGCTVGQAQIIYSNAFSGGQTTLNQTAPTVDNSVEGGIYSALWICTYTNGAVGSEAGTVLANGTLGTNAGSVLLPFAPQSGVVYFLTASLTLPASIGNWVGLGFSQSAVQGNAPNSERFTDGNVKGGPWLDVNPGKTTQFFGGPETSLASAAAEVEPTAGTYTLTIVLNTTGTKWTTAAYVNGTIQGTNIVGGTELGTNIVYATNPTIQYAGFTQQPIANTGGIQWNSFALIAVPLAVPVSYNTTINASSVLVTNFQGWGTTLSWWANVVGGYSNRDDYANIAFNQLKLNIVRYSIGADQNPAITLANQPYRALLHGFEPTNGVWNWNADLNQRWILQAAEARGANLVEAFATSPPWWMCVDSNVDGNVSGTNNLQVACEVPFAVYLATVISNLQVLDGDHFNYTIPMNEPSLSTTTDVQGGYENCHVSNDQQQRIIGDLRAQLNIASPSTVIEGTEDYDEYEAYVDLTAYSSTVLGDLGLFTTHTYIQNDAANLGALAVSQKKPLWVAEYSDTDGTGLTMAQHIHDDITGLGASAWIYWQFVDSDSGKGFLYNPLLASTNVSFTTNYTYNEKFYTIGQFSEFIRPGCKIISANDPNTLAAWNPTNATLVFVTVNTNTSSFNITYNLSGFPSATWYVATTQTAPDENLATLPSAVVTSTQFTSTLPASSVTTFVLTTNPPPPLLGFTLNGNTMGITWNTGVLQTATNAAGPYNNLPSATSPYMASFTNGQQFFRIKEN